ncbi:BEM_HP_G0080330.mRNA.1.CDS.1 [Saccharomyces cerevisiae]|nr:BEM_HP_G0080330.mRNA.1.CDS.1 [Saccharomyces cerevisiae]CAI6992087.1 BEM_HP_G0080330.mRNA.1.CDS.1 [Saccharomyces cerevisiae]
MLESSDNSDFALLAPPMTPSGFCFRFFNRSWSKPLYKRLSIIINHHDAIIGTSEDELTKGALELALWYSFIPVNDISCLHPLLQQIMSIKKDNIEKRIAVLERLPNFF